MSKLSDFVGGGGGILDTSGLTPVDTLQLTSSGEYTVPDNGYLLVELAGGAGGGGGSGYWTAMVGHGGGGGGASSVSLNETLICTADGGRPGNIGSEGRGTKVPAGFFSGFGSVPEAPEPRDGITVVNALDGAVKKYMPQAGGSGSPKPGPAGRTLVYAYATGGDPQAFSGGSPGGLPAYGFVLVRVKAGDTLTAVVGAGGSGGYKGGGGIAGQPGERGFVNISLYKG